jgi:hypothetical protein
MIGRKNDHPSARARGSSRLAILFGIAALLSLGTSSPAWAHNAKLGSPYVYTVGDDIAGRMRGILRIVAGLEETTLVYYDREQHDIVAEIIGGTDKVEEAKREIAAYVDAIQQGVVGYAKKRHNIDLTDKDITLIYYVDSDQGMPEEIVRREEGRFILPKEDEDDKE